MADGMREPLVTDASYHPVLVRDDRDAINTIKLEKPAAEEQQTHLLGRRVSLGILNIILASTTVLFNVAMAASLPLYALSVDKAESDAYSLLLFSAIWFSPILFMLATAQKRFLEPQLDLLKPIRRPRLLAMVLLAGLMNSLNGLLVVYTADPVRTPAYLQAILQTFIIPYTVICRLIILRKGVSLRRAVCTGIVVIGVFIALEPQIWNLDGSSSVPADKRTVAQRILYPAAFALGFLPAAIVNVIWEKEMKEEDSASVVFIAWTNLFQFIVILLFFWTDFIPGFGKAASFADFQARLHRGGACHYGLDPHCYSVAGRSWFFIMSYVLANMSGLLLVKYAEGAVYMVVVMALVTPLGSLFWSFFNTDPFVWNPHFNVTTVYTLSGLVIITPAVVVYNLFSQWDMAKERREAERAAEVAD